MDQQNTFLGAIPLDTDQMNQNRFTVEALGFLTQQAFGTGTAATGLACTPYATGLGVNIGPGAMTQLGTLAPVATGSMATDSTPCVQQGINTGSTPLNIAGSGTWTVYGSVLVALGGAVVLAYYSAANPAQTWAGPSNDGQPNQTLVTARVSLGITSGSVPSGAVTLWTVTVPAGATGMSGATIAEAAGAPFWPTIPQLKTGRLIGASKFTSAGVSGWSETAGNFTLPAGSPYIPTPGMATAITEAAGAGGGGGGVNSTTASLVQTSSGASAGSYLKALLTAAQVGASLAVTIGLGGAPAASGATAGSPGGNTTVGDLITCPGGSGGQPSAQTTGLAFASSPSNSPAPTAAEGVQVFVAKSGPEGSPGICTQVNPFYGASGKGGDGPFGAGGGSTGGGTAGSTGETSAGGSGACNGPSGGIVPGGKGGDGQVVIYEYA